MIRAKEGARLAGTAPAAASWDRQTDRQLVALVVQLSAAKLAICSCSFLPSQAEAE